MKKNFKNLMALVLTGAMLTAGTAVFAAPASYTGDAADASGTISGSGGKVETDGAKKIEVIIPTKVPDFVLDPSSAMSMIASTSPEIEKGATMYFESEYADPFADDLEVTKYGSQSAPAFFRNKGIMPVNLQATVTAAPGTSNIVTEPASKFKTGAAADAAIALAVSAVNKDGIVVAPALDIDDGVNSGAVVINTVIDDSRDRWTLEQDSDNPWKLNYNQEGDEVDMARTGITLKGEANVAYDWEAGYDLTSNAIDPSLYNIQISYELSQPAATVAKLDSMKDTDKVELTLTGLKKAASGQKSSIVIRGIETVEKKSTNDFVEDISVIPGATVADGKLTLTKAALQSIHGQFGGGVATLMISAPGSQGAVITIR